MLRQSITFTTPNNNWLKAQIDSQEYSSKSDVINDLIRQARRNEEELEILRAKLIRSEENGHSDRTLEQIRRETKTRLRENV